MAEKEEPDQAVHTSVIQMPPMVAADQGAKAEWERILPELQKSDAIQGIDSTILAGYCLNYSKVARAEAFLLQNNMTFRIGRKGYSQVRPEVSIVRECWKLMKTFADMLGLSPASRKRMKIMDPDEDDEFFDGKE